MLVTCAGRLFKQPIELEIPDAEYEAIQKLSSVEAQNQAIAEYGKRHLKKYGYDLGHCCERKRNVDFNFCIGCGIKQGQDRPAWQECKKRHLTYKYPTSKTIAKTIKKKNEKIESKLALTREELEMAKHMYLIDK
jgi:hypothetical protein